VGSFSFILRTCFVESPNQSLIPEISLDVLGTALFGREASLGESALEGIGERLDSKLERVEVVRKRLFGHSLRHQSHRQSLTGVICRLGFEGKVSKK